MKRATVYLPDDLKRRAEDLARKRGISLSELVRDVLRRESKGSTKRDPLFADDAVFNGSTPVDLTARLDDYLYGEGGSGTENEEP